MNSSILNNTAKGQGGGVYAKDDTNLNITKNSNISHNNHETVEVSSWRTMPNAASVLEP